MIYYNTSQEKENYLEQLYNLLSDIFISQEGESEENECDIS